MIKLYSRDNCPWCDKARDLIEALGLEYTELKLDRDFEREDLLALIGPVERLTVPQIFIDGKHVGDYTRFSQYVEDHAMMGSAVDIS